MASRASSIRFKLPTSQGLGHTKLPKVADFEGLERTASKSLRTPSSQTPRGKSRPASVIVENKRASTPAIPEFLSASYMDGSSPISPSVSGRSSAPPTQGISRRHSMLQFFGTTKPAQIDAPADAGTDGVLASVEPIKPNFPSRRSRIFRFFGLHRAQEPVPDTNDFLVPGVELQDGDRIILDRLDLSVLQNLRE